MVEEPASPIRFDDSLRIFVQLLSEEFETSILEAASFIRDATGRLSVVLGTEVPDDVLTDVATKVIKLLSGYARDDQPVRDIRDPSAPRLLQEAQRLAPVSCSDLNIHLLDRRVVGADWLQEPAPATLGVPKIVFSSLKGGVGRSTALAVTASYLSGRGRRVLAIDLDLEAPGIGTMLLEEAVVPQFGTLDYLVENGISGIDDSFLLSCQGKSFLGKNGGQVTVIPAIGRSTIDCPDNALAKISRSYLEDVQDDGATISFTEQVVEMVDRLADPTLFDVILIDARAGLHETTAAAILGLGAEILLFGVDEPQTYLGYRLLLSHLSRFRVAPDNDWRSRIQFVHAKSSVDTKKQRDAEVRFGDLYRLIYVEPAEDMVTTPVLTEDDFDLDWVTELPEDVIPSDEPPPVLRILDNERYQDFNPLADRELLSDTSFAATFESLTEWLDVIVEDDTGE